ERIEKRIADMKASGKPLRTDDNPEVLRRRLLAYRDQTAPLVTYYRLQTVLRSIDGMASIPEVTSAIDRILREARRPAAAAKRPARAEKFPAKRAAGRAFAKPGAKKSAPPRASGKTASAPKTKGRTGAGRKASPRKIGRQRRLTRRR